MVKTWKPVIMSLKMKQDLLKSVAFDFLFGGLIQLIFIAKTAIKVYYYFYQNNTFNYFVVKFHINDKTIQIFLRLLLYSFLFKN